MAEGGQKQSRFYSLGPGFLVAETFSEFTFVHIWKCIGHMI